MKAPIKMLVMGKKPKTLYSANKSGKFFGSFVIFFLAYAKYGVIERILCETKL